MSTHYKVNMSFDHLWYEFLTREFISDFPIEIVYDEFCKDLEKNVFTIHNGGRECKKMEISQQKAIRDLHAAIRDLRGARKVVALNRFENDDREIGQTLHFVEIAINQLSMLKLKDDQQNITTEEGSNS